MKVPQRGQFHAAIRVTPKRCDLYAQGPRSTRETDGIAAKLSRCGIASEALRLTRRYKGGFVKGWFWRTYPRSGVRSGGTSERALVLVLRSGGTPERALVPVFVPAEIRQNHPFGNHPFGVLRTAKHATKLPRREASPQCADLRTFKVENNELSGSLPAALQSLQEMVFFIIDRNRISGSIPHAACSSSKMWSFELGRNAQRLRSQDTQPPLNPRQGLDYRGRVPDASP